MLSIKKIGRVDHAVAFSVEGVLPTPVTFRFSTTLLSLWGYPSDEVLQQIITAYHQRHGLHENEFTLDSRVVEGLSARSYLAQLEGRG